MSFGPVPEDPLSFLADLVDDATQRYLDILLETKREDRQDKRTADANLRADASTAYNQLQTEADQLRQAMVNVDNPATVKQIRSRLNRLEGLLAGRSYRTPEESLKAIGDFRESTQQQPSQVSAFTPGAGAEGRIGSGFRFDDESGRQVVDQRQGLSLAPDVRSQVIPAGSNQELIGMAERQARLEGKDEQFLDQLDTDARELSNQVNKVFIDQVPKLLETIRDTKLSKEDRRAAFEQLRSNMPVLEAMVNTGFSFGNLRDVLLIEDEAAALRRLDEIMTLQVSTTAQTLEERIDSVRLRIASEDAEYQQILNELQANGELDILANQKKYYDEFGLLPEGEEAREKLAKALNISVEQMEQEAQDKWERGVRLANYAETKARYGATQAMHLADQSKHQAKEARHRANMAAIDDQWYAAQVEQAFNAAAAGIELTELQKALIRTQTEGLEAQEGRAADLHIIALAQGDFNTQILQNQAAREEYLALTAQIDYAVAEATTWPDLVSEWVDNGNVEMINNLIAEQERPGTHPSLAQGATHFTAVQLRGLLDLAETARAEIVQLSLESIAQSAEAVGNSTIEIKSNIAHGLVNYWLTEAAQGEAGFETPTLEDAQKYFNNLQGAAKAIVKELGITAEDLYHDARIDFLLQFEQTPQFRNAGKIVADLLAGNFDAVQIQETALPALMEQYQIMGIEPDSAEMLSLLSTAEYNWRQKVIAKEREDEKYAQDYAFNQARIEELEAKIGLYQAQTRREDAEAENVGKPKPPDIGDLSTLQQMAVRHMDELQDGAQQAGCFVSISEGAVGSEIKQGAVWREDGELRAGQKQACAYYRREVASTFARMSAAQYSAETGQPYNPAMFEDYYDILNNNKFDWEGNVPVWLNDGIAAAVGSVQSHRVDETGGARMATDGDFEAFIMGFISVGGEEAEEFISDPNFESYLYDLFIKSYPESEGSSIPKTPVQNQINEIFDATAETNGAGTGTLVIDDIASTVVGQYGNRAQLELSVDIQEYEREYRRGQDTAITRAKINELKEKYNLPASLNGPQVVMYLNAVLDRVERETALNQENERAGSAFSTP